MNRNQLNNLINNFEHSMEYLEKLRVKSFYKMFESLNKQVTLCETLNTYTKNDLDMVRKDLSISGISSLNKQKLAEALDTNIKILLPEILKKFTDSEYKLLENMLKQNGIVKYKDEFFDRFSYLRRFGIIGCFKDSNDNYHIFIPEDILLSLNSLINNIIIVSEIKQNEKVTKLLKGYLFYYGAIPFQKVYDMISKYIKNPLDMTAIFNIIYESSTKDNEIYFKENYWCSKQVRDLEELITHQNMKSNLDFISLTEKQILDASESNFVEWNEYDSNLIDFLRNNFTISKKQVLEYIEGMKLKFKIGCEFNAVVEQFSSTFEVEDLEHLKQSVELIIAVYNNSIQWVLKGYSPSLIRTGKNHLQPIQINTTQSSNAQIGRNAPCPCGSGKKYKNCCLK